jgi:glycosyltransferase involved in cell wall biosynthesis
MRSPRLLELPGPPAGKQGWPWTEETSPLPEFGEDGRVWPLISVVTPSYNQGEFIEETIRSVLLQGYPNLEYIVTDGGSNDGSVEIIKKYHRWLTYWTSEKDHGQADAINKGLDRASGVLANWLNSDDLLYLGALKRVAAAYFEDENALLYNGSALRIDAAGTYGSPYAANELCAESAFEGKIPLPQPAIFFKRESWLQHGKLKSFYYAMDTDLFFSCIVSGHARTVTGHPLALMRIHGEAKTAKSEALKPMFMERFEIFSALSRDPHIPTRIKKHIYYGLNRESLRIARVMARDKGHRQQALLWLLRAFRYSPKNTLFRFPDLVLGHYHR